MIKIPKHDTPIRHLNPFKKALAKYGQVVSATGEDKTYTVLKRTNIFGARYSCTCLDHFYRQHDCKHIMQFKQEEKTGSR